MVSCGSMNLNSDIIIESTASEPRQEILDVDVSDAIHFPSQQIHLLTQIRLSKRPEAAQTAAPRMGSIPIPHFGAGNKKTKSWTWKRQTTLPQDGGDLLLDNLQATSTGGERAVQTLSFSEETFRKIADHFFLHGSISKVISRADVPIFTHASLQMSRRGSTEAFSAYGEAHR